MEEHPATGASQEERLSWDEAFEDCTLDEEEDKKSSGEDSFIVGDSDDSDVDYGPAEDVRSSTKPIGSWQLSASQLMPRRNTLANLYSPLPPVKLFVGGVAVLNANKTTRCAAAAPRPPAIVRILFAERISFLSILLPEFQAFPKRLALLPD